MERSETLNELAAALSKAQGKLKSAAKDKENPFYKSSYAGLPSIMESCRQALSENGLSVSQITEYKDNEVWLETILLHSSGQFLIGKYPIRPVKSDPQGWGSAQTYARRYALMAMVGIVADDESDDDGHKASDRGTVSPYSSGPSKPANGNGLGTHDIGAAKKWCDTAIMDIKNMPNARTLHNWEDRNKPTLERLSTLDRKLFESVMDTINEMTEKLNPLSA